MIEAKVGHNPVDPGVEGTFKTKAANVLVCLEEGILVDVLRVVFRTGKVESESQDSLVVVTYEFLEGSAVAPLRLADQHRIVYAAFLRSHAAPRDGVLITAASSHPFAIRARVDSLANRNWDGPCIGRHVLSCPLLAR